MQIFNIKTHFSTANWLFGPPTRQPCRPPVSAHRSNHKSKRKCPPRTHHSAVVTVAAAVAWIWLKRSCWWKHRMRALCCAHFDRNCAQTTNTQSTSYTAIPQNISSKQPTFFFNLQFQFHTNSSIVLFVDCCVIVLLHNLFGCSVPSSPSPKIKRKTGKIKQKTKN